jgi:multiple sugar transport system permease protein
VAAVGFYHRLRWAPWIVDPATDEPVELTDDDRTRGRVEFRGRTIEFQPADVYEGCLAVTTLEINDTIRRLGRTLALYPLWSGDMTEFENLGVDPSDMGMFPFPGMTEKEQPVLQASNWFFMVGKDVLHRGGQTPEERTAYRNLVWELMWRITSPEGADENIRKRVAAGQSRFLNPRDLLRLGFDDYAREIPSDNRKLWTDVEEGRTLEVVEPFMGKWLQFRDFYAREAIDLVLRPSGKDFDYTSSLKRLEKEANSGTMFERPKVEIDRRRPAARVVAGLIAALLTYFTWLIFRGQFRKSASIAGVHARWAPWLMLAPALLSIGLWGYYPLVRGLVMAFQDYRIGGESPFVGLTNFISIYLDPNFYSYVFTTFRFVLWNLLLAFFTPIILAFLLAEVPRFKILFRTLYFLPQMTSGLVVSLMWKEMYDGTPKGTLNQMLAFVIGGDFRAVDWLGNPQTVMACVILPGVWAGAGIGSLIYLAALKSVPDDLYEAASIDGAGIFSRVRHISLPTIAPLILINFVGAFIGTFQSMGSIFLLTFGGPGKETMVMSMAIWQEAYINLRFSLATSYAWILGAILISFTYFQLRLLRRVDFRQAKET